MKERKKITSSYQRKAAAGLTIIELIVAVAIMVIMILVFGMILTQSQKVVSGSQKIMQSNNTAAAIANVIRNDLRKITKNGFLCITQYDGDDRPYLLFTTAGLVRSKLLNYTATGGLSTYGFTDDSSGNRNILFHQGWVGIKFNPDGFHYDAFVDAGFIKDVINVGLEDIQKMPRVDINTFINLLYSDGPIPKDNTLSCRPETLSGLNDAWQFLTDEIVNLNIMWTDGTRDLATNELYWYGISSSENADNANSKDSATDEPSDEWDGLVFAPGVAEFDAGGGDYRALWTRHDQNNWPTAIKIKFKIRDPNLSAAAENEGTTIGQGIWYEVICPIE
jgi:type II secretory pathway pseudopilin PulG